MAIVKNKKLFKGLSDEVKEEIVQKLVDNQVNFVQECVEQEMTFEEIQELSKNIMTDCIVKFLEANNTKKAEAEPVEQVEEQCMVYEYSEPEFVGELPARQDVKILPVEKEELKKQTKKGRPTKRK